MGHSGAATHHAQCREVYKAVEQRILWSEGAPPNMFTMIPNSVPDLTDALVTECKANANPHDSPKVYCNCVN